MQTKTTPTFTATIYCGLKLGYDGPITPIEEVRAACQAYVDRVGLAVTFTPTDYLYTKGSEPGVAIGLINYPRFPSESIKIKDHALAIASIAKDVAKQQRVTVVCSDETFMLE